jgi:Lrp/AsnC family transcriptional regulator, regulator for asnA, asnC and gidA
MNELDCGILKELISNPQISFSAIAKKLNISQNTVKKRYEKMVKEKTILRSSITIDLLKIGFQGRARFTIRTDQKILTIEALKKIPNIVMVAETYGDYDVIAFAIVKDYTSMMDISNVIKEIPTIKQVDVSLEETTHFPVSEQFNYITW